MKNKRLRWEAIILITLYVMYGAMMLCRNTIVVASPALIQDPALNMDKAQYGKMMAYGSAGGLLGKLTLGVPVDRFGGRFMLLVTLAMVLGSTAAFGFLSLIPLFFFLNFFGMWIKSAGWMSMGAIVRKWYSRTRHGRVWGIISTSSRVGVITSTLLLGYLLTFLSWRIIFFVAGGIATVALVMGYFVLLKDPSEVGLTPPVDGNEEKTPGPPKERPPHRLAGFTLKETLWDFATSQRVWFIALSVGALTLLMDFINFVPIYLAETLELTAGQAGMTSTVFPAGCFVAVLVGGFLYDRLSKRQHTIVFGGLLILAAACVMVLWAIPRTGLPTAACRYLAMAAIFTFGASVSPAYYIPMSVFSVDYGGPRLGILMGIIDAFGYTGATIFNYFAGSIAQNYGWDIFLLVLFSGCLVAALLVSRFMYLEAVAHERSSS